MPPDDEARLRHLIDATEEAVSFVEGRQRVVLDQDKVWRRGLAVGADQACGDRGEAAKQVSEPVRAGDAAVAWGCGGGHATRQGG